MIIIGGRKCDECGEINPRKSMLKLTRWHSEWADEWVGHTWLCNVACLTKHLKKLV